MCIWNIDYVTVGLVCRELCKFVIESKQIKHFSRRISEVLKYIILYINITYEMSFITSIIIMHISARLHTPNYTLYDELFY